MQEIGNIVYKIKFKRTSYPRPDFKYQGISLVNIADSPRLHKPYLVAVKHPVMWRFVYLEHPLRIIYQSARTHNPFPVETIQIHRFITVIFINFLSCGIHYCHGIKIPDHDLLDGNIIGFHQNIHFIALEQPDGYELTAVTEIGNRNLPVNMILDNFRVKIPSELVVIPVALPVTATVAKASGDLVFSSSTRPLITISGSGGGPGFSGGLTSPAGAVDQDMVFNYMKIKGGSSIISSSQAESGFSAALTLTFLLEFKISVSYTK
jgi:hypothetical protein